MTTDRVVDHAVGIVDAEGFEALTIRRLAEACGLSPMAVYRHVRDKEELLDRVVDRVTSEWAEQLPEPADDWRDDVRNLLRRARELHLAHPGVAQLCVARPTPVAGVARIFDRMIGSLERGGFDGARAVLAFDALLMFLFGSVVWEIPRGEDARERLVAVSADAVDAPRVFERRAELARRNPEAYFEFGLDALIAGLAALLAELEETARR
jgi:TetR/AcrR family tetracycline transcriptional repressor